ncbi:hypothetical protein EVAR_25170_1 [Eumeta japonica]|uniref:Uncharacterized protein n=1 Tax=Eumeta variegata TaxID=151549 RepID=A0A4C1VSI2_EUMVA|nr:hypothetical protein EVAR_25170_1 [Eumeta japonica]
MPVAQKPERHGNAIGSRPPYGRLINRHFDMGSQMKASARTGPFDGDAGIPRRQTCPKLALSSRAGRPHRRPNDISRPAVREIKELNCSPFCRNNRGPDCHLRFLAHL